MLSGEFFWSRQVHSSLCLLFNNHLFPDQSIRSHPGPSLALYTICNMSQQSTWELAMLTPETHTHSLPSVLQVLQDRITPCGAALIPPGSPLSLSFPAPSLCNMVMSLPIRPSCHCTVVCVYVRQLHCLTPGVDTEKQSDGGCHLTASNST